MINIAFDEWEIFNILSKDSDYCNTVEVIAIHNGILYSALGVTDCGELIDVDNESIEMDRSK